MKLPDSFELRMQDMLGDEYEAFLAGYDKEHFSGLRLNRLKTDNSEWERIAPFPSEKIPWIDNGYYFDPKRSEFTRHPYYYAGMYYIQEPSAMTPANILPIEPGDRVLDLCAAPGGKSTELAAKLGGKGVLVSNDISSTRAKALVKNLGVFGVRNFVIVSEEPSKLAKFFPRYFDKILIDAPCSGEGMFRKDPAIMKNWEQYGTGYYNNIQKDIILEAAKMLRPGGMMLYSTCTFSPDENEGTINYLLENDPGFEVVDITDHYEGFSKGHPEWINSGRDELSGCVRIWPHKMNGEGHFVTLLHKKEEEGYFRASYNYIKKAKLTEEEGSFLNDCGISVQDLQRIELHGDKLYLIPEDLPDVTGLRLLRNGLYLGDRKKNRFEPSQPLAMALSKSDYPFCIDLDINDERVIKYLKCETIETNDDVRDGYVLICCMGHPLGWGKKSGNIIKNKYFAGWRMM